MRNVRLALLVLIASLAAPLSADADGAAGTLNIGVIGEVVTLDPALADDDASRLVLLNVYDQLFEYDHLARPFELRPGLARSMPTVSTDQRLWTIELRDDVRFHDDPCFETGKGRLLTAHDVVFCLERLMDAGLPTPGRWLLERRVVGIDAFTEASKRARPNPRRHVYDKETGYPDVAGLQAVDDHTIQIRLEQPYPALPWVLATSYGSIYPPEAVAHYGAGLATHVVTTGPYRLKAHLSTKKMIFERSPVYRSADGKQPSNDIVVVSAAPDEMQQFARFQAAEVDLCVVPRDARWSIVAPDGGGGFVLLEPFRKRGVVLHDDPYLEVYYEAFNMQDPVLGHPAGAKGLALRRAICLVSDDTWVIERLHGGLATPIQGPLLPEFTAWSPFVNPWQMQPDEDPEAVLELAKETLADAGMAGGEGVPVIVKDVLDFKSSRMRFDRFKERAAQAGLRFEANYVSWKDLRARIKDGKARMWNISWRLDYPDPENLLQLFYGPFAPVPNDSRYANPRYDKLYEKALAMPPGVDRDIVYEEMQEIAVEDCIYRWRFRRRRLALTQPWLDGYRFNDIAPNFFRHCRVDEAKRAAVRRALREKEQAGG